MGYNIFICDDEPQILKQLSMEIKDILEDSEIFVFKYGYDMFSEWENCDILLLDIDMPQISGLDIASRLTKMEKRPLLVFVTSHDELVYDSLKFHPFGFVRKSHMEDELSEILTDCVKELSGRGRYFCFQVAGTRIKLPLCKILYFEADGNYLKLFMQEGDILTEDGRGINSKSEAFEVSGEVYRFRETLGFVETALSGDGFVRTHKGFLVNQAAVRSLGVDKLILVNGTCIPIGRNYAKEAKHRLMQWMLRA
ncbi:MAG: LytTR family DNA-binding domain-containing protein [Lachnospiraceae bacterium]|nr:LytTR family DNA-binding domain-containing protein [Lachnospiraceae bacterium]